MPSQRSGFRNASKPIQRKSFEAASKPAPGWLHVEIRPAAQALMPVVRSKSHGPAQA